MTNKHTPGPWRLKDGSIEMGPEDGRLGFWATFGCGGQLPNPSGQDHHEEVKANARLAWCSPELLEAAEGLASDVQCLVDCRDDCGEWGAECPLQDAHKPDGTIERLQRLLDAIGKARGGEA